MGQKGRGGKIDPKIELLSPIAKELKQAESDVKRKKKEGQSTPRVPIFIHLWQETLRKETPKTWGKYINRLRLDISRHGGSKEL